MAMLVGNSLTHWNTLRNGIIISAIRVLAAPGSLGYGMQRILRSSTSRYFS